MSDIRKITVEIRCDNAAFDENPAVEIASILYNAAIMFDDFAATSIPHTPEDGIVRRLRDHNGNIVGTIKVEREEDQDESA